MDKRMKNKLARAKTRTVERLIEAEKKIAQLVLLNKSLKRQVESLEQVRTTELGTIITFGRRPFRGEKIIAMELAINATELILAKNTEAALVYHCKLLCQNLERELLLYWKTR